MVRALTTDEFVAKATKVHGGRFTYEKAVYENKHSKIVVTCPEHGDYIVSASIHLQGHICKRCVYDSLKGKKQPIKNQSTFSRLIAESNNEMFFDGSECGTCGGVKRYTCNNSCAQCAVIHRKRANEKWNDVKRSIYKQSNVLRDDQDIQLWISQIYASKREMQKIFGVPLDIDHIVPINGENVSGLHVPWNMRITTSRFNRSKQNKVDDSVGSMQYGHVSVHQSALPWNLRKESQNDCRI